MAVGNRSRAYDPAKLPNTYAANQNIPPACGQDFSILRHNRPPWNSQADSISRQRFLRRSAPSPSWL